IAKAASRIRKTINNENTPIPRYTKGGSSKSKATQSKSYSFQLTIFYYPGKEIMDKLDVEEVPEQSFTSLGSGACMLEETLNEREVKNEMVTLMASLSKKKEDFFQDLEITYLQKQGNRKFYKTRFFNKKFQFNTNGLKTIGGKDTKKVFIVINKNKPSSVASNFKELLKSHRDSNAPEISDYSHSDSSDDDFQKSSRIFPSSPMSPIQPSKKRKKSNLFPDDIPLATPVMKSSPLEIILTLPSLTGYQTSNEHEKLISVLMMLRHFNGFFNAVCEAIKVKGEDAADIEHLFAQVKVFQ
uniref:Uncharacterized protein n=1 Tax=Clytia hemisphaerica TaxID=252671 RepID=A0A7M5XN29_9CNID